MYFLLPVVFFKYWLGYEPQSTLSTLFVLPLCIICPRISWCHPLFKDVMMNFGCSVSVWLHFGKNLREEKWPLFYLSLLTMNLILAKEYELLRAFLQLQWCQNLIDHSERPM